METSTDSLILRYSGSELTDQQSFHNPLVEKISEARATRDAIYAELVYDNIAPSWMANVEDALERAKAGFCESYNPFTLILRVVAISSFLHNADQVWCHQSHTEWLLSGQLTQNEFRTLHVTADSDYVFPDGPFVRIQKSPNVAFNVPNAAMPRMSLRAGGVNLSRNFAKTQEYGSWSFTPWTEVACLGFSKEKKSSLSHQASSLVVRQ